MIIWSAAQLLSEQRENRWATYISAEMLKSSSPALTRCRRLWIQFSLSKLLRLLAFSKCSTNSPILWAVRPCLPAFQQSRSAVSQILLGQTDHFAKAFSTSSDSALCKTKPTNHLPYNNLLCCWMSLSRLPKKKASVWVFWEFLSTLERLKAVTQ